MMVTVVLSACGNNNSQGDSSSSSKKTTVSMIGYGNEVSKKAYFELLNKQFPEYDIQYQYVDSKQFQNIVTTYLAGGEGPDIIEGADSRWIASGYLEDLTDQPFMDKYYDTGLKPYTQKGRTYAIPLQSWFEGVWYNKEMFEQNNLSVPNSFDEWMDVHDKLREAGLKPQIMHAKSWEPMMKQSIGVALNDFYSKSESSDFDDKFGNGEATLYDNWLSAFQKWSDTVVKKNLDTDMLGIEYDQALDEFAMGKAAMWQAGPWAYDTLMEKNPDLKLGMFPIPGSEEGSGWLLGGPGSAWSINKNSKNKEAALKILEFTSTPEAQEALIASNFGTSFLKGYDNSDLPEQYEDSKVAFNEGHVYMPWANWGAIAGDGVVMELGKLLQDHLAGGITIEKVLEEADKKANQLRDAIK